jgi:hypothetical protein
MLPSGCGIANLPGVRELTCDQISLVLWRQLTINIPAPCVNCHGKWIGISVYEAAPHLLYRHPLATLAQVLPSTATVAFKGLQCASCVARCVTSICCPWFAIAIASFGLMLPVRLCCDSGLQQLDHRLSFLLENDDPGTAFQPSREGTRCNIGVTVSEEVCQSHVYLD